MVLQEGATPSPENLLRTLSGRPGTLRLPTRQPLSHSDAPADAESERPHLATKMVRLVTHSANASFKSRLVGIRFATLTLRLRQNWTQLFGDADTAAIALAIVFLGSERLLRDELDPQLKSLAVPIPVEALASCNISSIASATGFNRETARRKVNQLVQIGMVVREGSQIRLAPGFTQQQAVMDLIRSQLDELRRTANDLLRGCDHRRRLAAPGCPHSTQADTTAVSDFDPNRTDATTAAAATGSADCVDS